MTDAQKFEGFKKVLADENEKKYGAEIRQKYGDAAVDAANAKFAGLSPERYDEGERLRVECEEALKLAFEAGDPASELAMKACDLHRRWLCVYAPEYNKEYHKNLGEMYVADARFRDYYDKIAEGCAQFLRDTINVYCGD